MDLKTLKETNYEESHKRVFISPNDAVYTL